MLFALTQAPDGGYEGWNTAEGSGALFSLTTSSLNTAVGGHALYGNISQSANTAVGAFALAANNPGNQNVAVGQALRTPVIKDSLPIPAARFWLGEDDHPG
jgi:hypothetical protein